MCISISTDCISSYNFRVVSPLLLEEVQQVKIVKQISQLLKYQCGFFSYYQCKYPEEFMKFRGIPPHHTTFPSS